MIEAACWSCPEVAYNWFVVMCKGSIGVRLASVTLLYCCLVSPIHMEPVHFTSVLNFAKPSSCAPLQFNPHSRQGDLGWPRNLLQLQYNLLLDISSQRET